MSFAIASSPVYSKLFGDAELAQLLGDENEIAAMIAFERALARVQGEIGVIPASAGEGIDKSLAELRVPPASLAEGLAASGVPVPTLVKLLREALDEDLGHWVHWGATSQDVVDSAHVLMLKDCLAVLESRLGTLIAALEKQSRTYETTVMAGRTRSQIATPITFGLRIAQWASPLIEAEADLPHLKARLLRIQFGGAAGANTAVGPHGPIIAERLAAELGLGNSPPWHVNRTGILACAAWLAQLGAALSKIAGDLILMGRGEIGEAQAGQGGGSSTMPQKSNPVTAEAVQTLSQVVATLAGGLNGAANPIEERDGGRWAVEWFLLPQAVVAVGAALRHTLGLVESLSANPEVMRATLDRNPGAMAEAASFAMASQMPRARAQEVVKQALAGGRPLREVLSEHGEPGLDPEQVLNPESVVAACISLAKQIFARRENAR